MSFSKIIPDDAKDEFWTIVRDCLRAFHKMTTTESRRKVTQFRKKFDNMSQERIEYFYHSEPFDVACDLAGRPLKLEDHLDQYLQIRDATPGNGVPTKVLQRPSKVK